MLVDQTTKGPRVNVLPKEMQEEWRAIEHADRNGRSRNDERRRIITFGGFFFTIAIMFLSFWLVYHAAFIVADKASQWNETYVIAASMAAWGVATLLGTIMGWSFVDHWLDRIDRAHALTIHHRIRNWWVAMDTVLADTPLGDTFHRIGFSGGTGNYGNRGNLTVVEHAGQLWLENHRGHRLSTSTTVVE